MLRKLDHNKAVLDFQQLRVVFELVLLNIAVNARNAIPNGGAKSSGAGWRN
jgi:hypothetical protein